MKRLLLLALAVALPSCTTLRPLEPEELQVFRAVLREDPFAPGTPLLADHDLAPRTRLRASAPDPTTYSLPGPVWSAAPAPTALLAALPAANRHNADLPKALFREFRPDRRAARYVVLSRPAFDATRQEAVVVIAAHPKTCCCGWGFTVHLRLSAGAWRVVAVGDAYVS